MSMENCVSDNADIFFFVVVQCCSRKLEIPVEITGELNSCLFKGTDRVKAAKANQPETITTKQNNQSFCFIAFYFNFHLLIYKNCLTSAQLSVKNIKFMFNRFKSKLEL
jgi:hypothetical protein